MMSEARVGDVELEMPQDIQDVQEIEEMIGDATRWLNQSRFAPKHPEMTQRLADGLVILFGRLIEGDPEKVKSLELQVASAQLKVSEMEVENERLSKGIVTLNGVIESRDQQIKHLNEEIELAQFDLETGLRRQNAKLTTENRSLKSLLIHYLSED